MITPVAINFNSKTYSAKLKQNQNISFGWCEAHIYAMNRIDIKEAEKIKEFSSLFNWQRVTQKTEAAKIINSASQEAAKIMVQYANLMGTTAEVAPSYAFSNAKETQDAIDKSEFLNDPVILLNIIHSISDMDAKLDNDNPIRKERAKGAAQLFSVSIMLDLIKKNRENPKYQHFLAQIDKMTKITEDTLKDIYGDDVFDKIRYFASLNEKPSDDDKKRSLEFLVEIDKKAYSLEFDESFNCELNKLLNEYLKTGDEDILSQKPKLKTKLAYPDHDHNPLDTAKTHAHQTHTHNMDTHDYMHILGIPHTHNNN